MVRRKKEKEKIMNNYGYALEKVEQLADVQKKLSKLKKISGMKGILKDLEEVSAVMEYFLIDQSCAKYYLDNEFGGYHSICKEPKSLPNKRSEGKPYDFQERRDCPSCKLYECKGRKT